jgi:hypothetical protein
MSEPLRHLFDRWGLLEVMGEAYHPAATAVRDHDRARLFKD